ncbi:MAG TPA: ester cyclase [Solirubrobacteraceae bacterium]|jgi:predicted ester cyclase
MRILADRRGRRPWPPHPSKRPTGEIAAYFEDAFAGLPDFHMTIRNLAAQGDDVYVHWHLTGTHTGPLLGIAPTGRPIAVDGIDRFVMRDGEVASNFVVFDQMQYARGIGMMPPDGSAGDKALKAACTAKTAVIGRLKRGQGPAGSAAPRIPGPRRCS